MLPEHMIRVETGVFEGAEVSPYYDPMIAKLVARGEDRDAAIAALANATSVTAVWPIKTNAAFLLACLNSERFRIADLDTGLIASEGDALIPNDQPPAEVLKAGAMAVAVGAIGQPVWQCVDTLGGREEADRSPLKALFGFRLNRPPKNELRISVDGVSHEVSVPNRFGKLNAWIETAGKTILSGVNDGRVFAVSADRPYGTGQASAADGAILAPMPGKVIAVDVTEGQAVTAGQRLMVLEAMKMEHALAAPFDGVIEGLAVSAGGQVQVEAVLCRVVPE
jgi:3-methylcrotonyl-CoA carboxylase alpha subunit